MQEPLSQVLNVLIQTGWLSLAYELCQNEQKICLLPDPPLSALILCLLLLLGFFTTEGFISLQRMPVRLT